MVAQKETRDLGAKQNQNENWKFVIIIDLFCSFP